MKILKVAILVSCIFVLGACATTQPVNDNSSNLTVGTVQKEIKIGMSNADVVSVLGSPNMVTTDAQRREVWVYDKVSTERVSKSGESWVFALIAGGSSKSSSSSTNQKTLTIIIKFDETNTVRDFSYHTSSF